MADISAATIKELRETSGAGMMDCKKALQETSGNFEEAIDWLRKKGLAKAAKKSGRAASEGLVAITSSGTKAAMIELNSETDFVAKNEQFQALVSAIAGYALKGNGDLDALNAYTCEKAGKPVSEVVAEHVGTIGENLQLRRSIALSVKDGVIATYIHNAYTPTMGKIGVLVALESTGKKDVLEALGKQIAMHIAAARPESLDVATLDPALVEREKNIFADQARQSGKPDNIIEKMIEGRIRKYYEEAVLLEQVFVMDGKTKVAQVVKNAEKDAGAPIALKAFARFALGEGVEKKQENFAEEVAATAANA